MPTRPFLNVNQLIHSCIKLLGLSVITVFTVTSLSAQFEVQNADNPPFDPQRLIEDVFLGEGVEVVNITYDGETGALGYFKGGNAAVGLDEGIIMTTGQVKTDAFGRGVDAPSQDDAQFDNGSTVVDANLTQIVPNDPNGDSNVFNVSRYTITFIPKGDRVRFRYVFASEEYPEFVCSNYNDIFGFFLEGPGISGPFQNNGLNLATVPGTANMPVTINSINPGVHGTPGGTPTGCNGADQSLAFSAFYVDNTTSGNFPVYDGMTTVLTAESVVVPCQQYTMQMTIGDIGDASYDSGVFLEAKSFSTPILTVDVATISLAGEVAEGCEPGEIIFRANEVSSVDRTIPYTVGGTATAGIDYATLPGSVTIPAGDTEVRIPIFAIQDGIVEPLETLTVTVATDLCTTKTVEMKIVDRAIPPVPLVLDTTVCLGDPVPLDGTLPTTVDTETTFSNSGIGFITTPNVPFYSDINVTGINPLVLRGGLILQVCMDIQHSRTEDLDIYLFAPDGDYLELSTDNGGSAAGGYDRACFRSDASLLVSDPSVLAPISGEFLPEGSWGDLWDGTAASANGTWRLQVTDDENGQNGLFRGWDITFAPVYSIDYSWSPAAGLSCIDCPDPVATPTSTTIYTLTATDSYGCTEQASVRIAHAPDIVAPVVNCSPTFDEVEFTWNLDPGVTNYEISINGGAFVDVGTNTSHTESGLGFNETVSIVVRANGQCNSETSTSSCTTQNCTNYTVGTAPVDVTCGGGADGSVSVTPNGGVSPYTFTVGTTSNTTGIFTGLAAGNYTVSVSDNNGCGGSAIFSINEPSSVITSTSVAPPASCGDPFVATAVGSAGAGGPFTYTWSDAQTGPNANFTVSGKYYVDVEDVAGCAIRDSVTITVPDPLAASYTFDHIECNGGTDGEITVTGRDGFGSYMYSIGAGFGSSGTFTGLSAGSHTVTVRDAIGCTVDTTIILDEPQLLLVTLDKDDVSCFGGDDGNVRTTVTGGTGTYTYVWAGLSSVNPDLNDVIAGVYSVTVSDQNGCDATASITIEEPDVLQVSLTEMPVVCFGESSGQLQASTRGGTAPFSFTWSTGPTTSDSLLTGVPAGNHQVTVTDALNCTASTSFTVTQPSALSASHSVVPVGCAGNTTGEIDLRPAGGIPPYRFQWSDGPTTEDRTGLSTGTYDVIITDNNNCTISYQIVLSQPPALTISATHTDVSCFGYTDGTIQVIANGGLAPYFYSWSGPAGYAFFGPNPTQLVAGDYTLDFRDSYGCTWDTTITVLQPIAISLTATARDSICFGATNGVAAVVVTGGTAPFDFEWENGETRDSAFALNAGTHTVEVTDANSCTFSTSVELFELPEITLTLDQTGVLCYGDSNGTASVIRVNYGSGIRPVASLSYTWESDPTLTGEILTGLGGEQEANVYGVDSRGCTVNGAIEIVTPTQVRASSRILNNVNCFGGSDGAAEAIVEGGTAAYTYRWLTTTATPNQAIASDLLAGSHEVEVSDANGCLDTATVSLFEPDSLAVNFNVRDVNCFALNSGFIEATVNGGSNPYLYAWQSGQTSSSLDSVREGSYVLTTTDDNNCIRIDTVMVGTASEVELTGTAYSVSCHGDRDGAIELIATGGNEPHQFAISGVDFNQFSDFRYLNPGAYYAIAEDRDGCPSDTVWLEVDEPQPMIIEAGEEVSVVLGESVDLNAQVFNANPPVDFLWIPNDPDLFSCQNCPNPEFRPIYQGVVTVQAIDSLGCEAEDVIRVRISKELQVAVPTGFTPNGDGENDLLLVHGKTGTRVNTFKVFDRWGDLVYTDGNFMVNNLTRGWDGRVRGAYQNGGTYIWHLEVEYLDGIVETISGQTTIIR